MNVTLLTDFCCATSDWRFFKLLSFVGSQRLNARTGYQAQCLVRRALTSFMHSSILF